MVEFRKPFYWILTPSHTFSEHVVFLLQFTFFLAPLSRSFPQVFEGVSAASLARCSAPPSLQAGLGLPLFGGPCTGSRGACSGRRTWASSLPACGTERCGISGWTPSAPCLGPGQAVADCGARHSCRYRWPLQVWQGPRAAVGGTCQPARSPVRKPVRLVTSGCREWTWSCFVASDRPKTPLRGGQPAAPHRTGHSGPRWRPGSEP